MSLHRHINDRNFSMLQYCLLTSINPDIRSPGNMTPLHHAAIIGFYGGAELLIKFGANIDLVDSNSNTALHLACKNDNVNVVMLLLENDADMSLINKDGHTAKELTNNPVILSLFDHYHFKEPYN